MASPIAAAALLAAANSQRSLTPAQVREIRLSVQSNGDAARRYDIARNSIRQLRAGQTYGELRPDERTAQRTRNRTQLEADSRFSVVEDCIAIGRLFPLSGMADQDRQEAKDAAHECSHGRLPHDRTAACGCWPGEVSARPTPNPRRSNATPDHQDRLARFADQAAATATPRDGIEGPARVDDHRRSDRDQAVPA